MTTEFDPVQHKERQRQEWSAAAEAWRKYWPIMEPALQPVSDRLLDMAKVVAGSRVLDIATGIGEPAVSAAQLVGKSGHVTATDISPGMLSIARERIADLGLGNVELREIDAEALDFPAGSFDAVVCRFGLMFLPDVSGALRQIRSMLVPGGRVSAAVWSAPPKVPMLSVTLGVIQRELNIPPPPPGSPGPFSLADPDVLERTFADAGFTDMTTEPIAVDWEVASSEVYVTFIKEIAAPVAAMVGSEPPQRQREIWQAVEDAVSAFADDDGTIRLPNEAILATASHL